MRKRVIAGTSTTCSTLDIWQAASCRCKRESGRQQAGAPRTKTAEAKSNTLLTSWHTFSQQAVLCGCVGQRS